VTPHREKLVARGLWTLYAVLAVGGLALLAEALFVPRRPRPFDLKLPSAEAQIVLSPLPTVKDALLGRRFTRRVAGVAAAPATSAKPQELPLDRLIKLTGILDFGGKQPTLAVIETPVESKAYKAGDRVGETGVLIKDIREYVVVEFESRRFKVTFLGIQELAANAVGKD
jgi:hypothetical protein